MIDWLLLSMDVAMLSCSGRLPTVPKKYSPIPPIIHSYNGGNEYEGPDLRRPLSRSVGSATLVGLIGRGAWWPEAIHATC